MIRAVSPSGRVQFHSTRRRRGAAAVEMAFVAPIFFLLIMGTIEAARMGMAAQLMNVAAREGCRTAVLQGRTLADVQTRIDAILDGSGVTPSTITVTPTNWETATPGTAITVSLGVPFGELSWLGDPLHMGSTVVGASATLSSEKERY